MAGAGGGGAMARASPALPLLRLAVPSIFALRIGLVAGCWKLAQTAYRTADLSLKIQIWAFELVKAGNRSV